MYLTFKDLVSSSGDSVIDYSFSAVQNIKIVGNPTLQSIDNQYFLKFDGNSQHVNLNTFSFGIKYK